MFSLLRGSGLKCYIVPDPDQKNMFSLLRGSGLKWDDLPHKAFFAEVLPLAREWIEITHSSAMPIPPFVLPLAREWIEMQQQLDI